MTNIVQEVRFKMFWLLSNVLGSELYFYKYGFQFLKKVYEANMLWEERDSRKVQN